MAKVILATILLMGLLGSASMEISSGQLSENGQTSPMQNGALGGTIRQLPARGMSMMNQLFGGARNWLPSRNGSTLKLDPELRTQNETTTELPYSADSHTFCFNSANIKTLVEQIYYSWMQGRYSDIVKLIQNTLQNNFNNGQQLPVTSFPGEYFTTGTYGGENYKQELPQ